MIIVYILSTMWSIGCIILPLIGVWYLWKDGDTMPAAFVLFVVWPLCCLLAVTPWAMIASEQSPNLATLKKNEWFCSASHTVPVTTYVKSGNTMVPVTSYHKKCDQYNHR